MVRSGQINSRRRLIVFTALVFVTVLAVGALFVRLVEDGRLDDKRRDLDTIGSTLAYSLQRQLDRSLSSTFALASMVRQRDTPIVDSFDSIAADMISSYGGIDSLQLAPDGIVSLIYPLEGNEAAIGHDLLDDPARRVEALAAIESRELTLAGPFTLVQGGVAVIGRLPVFVPDGAGGDRFWGFAIALIRLPTLLGATNLEQVVGQGYAYELSRVHPDTGARHVFATSAGKDIQHSMTFPIEVPNGTWTLHLAQSDGQSPGWLAVRGGGLVTVVSALVAVLFYQSQQRASERKRAEHALRASEQEQRRLSRENAIIAEVGRIMSSSLDTDEVYERFAAEVRKLIPCDRVVVNLIDHQRGALIVYFVAGTDVGSWRRGDVVPLPGSIAEAVIRSRRTLVVQAESTEELVRRFPTLTPAFAVGLRSAIAAPMVSNDEVVGVFNFWSMEAEVYSQRDLDLAERIGVQIAGAIASSRLFSERMQVEDQLRASLQEKEVLLKEVNHRVKNNLQIVSSLLNLQSRKIEDPEVSDVLRAGKDRIKSMALVHEQLYRSEDLARIDFGDYLRTLTGNLLRSYRVDPDSVRINIAISQVLLDVDTAIPCGLIINELVSNCLEHAFPDGRTGEIGIEVQSFDTDRIAIVVRDNGVGLSDELDIGNADSMGLQLVTALIEQLGATVQVTGDRGTEFRIRFRVSREDL